MFNLSNILKKNCLPNLITLNLNRKFHSFSFYLFTIGNRGRYRGIHCLQQCLLTQPTPSPLLENLHLSDNFGEISVLELLCSDVLRTRPRLVVLDISQNSLALNDTEAINLLQRKKSLNLYTLQSLDLSFNSLSDEYFYSFLQMMWPLSSSNTLEKQFSRQLSHGSPGKQKSPALKMKQRIHLRDLTINNSQIGNKCFTYLGCLLNEGRFSQLRSLSLGMNNAAGQDGIEMILTALLPYQIEKNASKEEKCDEASEEIVDDNSLGEIKTQGDPDAANQREEIDDWRKGFKFLSIPMNPLSNDGLLAIMTAGTAGAFRYIEVSE